MVNYNAMVINKWVKDSWNKSVEKKDRKYDSKGAMMVMCLIAVMIGVLCYRIWGDDNGLWYFIYSL